MMGYDSASEDLIIPLKYVLNSNTDLLYHVKYKNLNEIGNDNRFCGDIEWPCLNI
jgi:hypothetical protein